MKRVLKKQNKGKRIYVTLMVLIGVMAGVTGTVCAADTIFSAGIRMIDDAKGFIISISTAVLVVALGVAHFMKSSSNGNPQKIEMANKATTNAIIGWTLVNGATLITTTIQQYIK